MAKLYTVAGDKNTVATVNKAVKMSGDLAAAKPEVAVRMVVTDDGSFPLVKRGHPCQATVRITKAADRCLLAADVIIDVDAKLWEELTDAQRIALLDHELTHIAAKLDSDTGQPKIHPDGRPVLKMRHHDWEIGGFRSVVTRHGAEAPEARQIAALYTAEGQGLFGWMTEAPRRSVG